MSDDIEKFDYVIVGAGITGSATFYLLSQFARVLLIDDHPEPIDKKILKVFPEHNFTFMPELPRENKQIFPRDHRTSIYASNSLESKVDSNEFHQPFGKIANQYYLNKWFQDQGLTKNGSVLWGFKAIDIETQPVCINIKLKSNRDSNHEEKTIQAQVILIATGSNFELQQKLGFSTPDPYNVLIAVIESNRDALDQNLPSDYIFRVHPKISTTGPLAMLRADSYFNLGYLSKESYEEMTEKFIRILNNYQPIQAFFKDAKKDPHTFTKSDIVFGKCAKYPIKTMVKERIIVLGEAAGLVTPVYYEGVLGALASARVVSEILGKLKQKASNYSQIDLADYENEIHRRLKNYFKTAEATEILFLKSGDNQIAVWDSYIDCIQKIPKLRSFIHQAYICKDVGNYPLENDQWSGEEIFKNLPLGRKIALTPLFLRAKFS